MISGHEFDHMQQSDALKDRCAECRQLFHPSDVVPKNAQLENIISTSKNQIRRDIYDKLKSRTEASFQKVYIKTIDALTGDTSGFSQKHVLHHVRKQYDTHLQQITTLQGELAHVLTREEKSDDVLLEKQETLLKKSRDLQLLVDAFNKHRMTHNHVHTAIKKVFDDCVEADVCDAHSEWLITRLQMIIGVMPSSGDHTHVHTHAF
jgi:hypothetical protein